MQYQHPQFVRNNTTVLEYDKEKLAEGQFRVVQSRVFPSISQAKRFTREVQINSDKKMGLGWVKVLPTKTRQPRKLRLAAISVVRRIASKA